MAVFCDQTGVRIVAPSGDESADAKAYQETTGNLRPLSVEVDPENGWKIAIPPPPPKPQPEPKTTAAPSVERAPKTAAPAAKDAPRKGKE